MSQNQKKEAVFAYHPPSSRRGMMTNSDEPDEEKELTENLRFFIRQELLKIFAINK